MLTIYLFFTTLKLFCSLGSAVVSFRIASLRMTPTMTYTLFAIAFALIFMLQVESIFFTTKITQFISGFYSPLVIGNLFVETAVNLLFFIALMRKYTALRNAGLK